MRLYSIHFIFPATISVCTLFSSCQLMHVSPTHNTPYFTDKQQSEISTSIAPSGLNGNIAYSPVKYVSLQANAFCNLNSRYFNNQFEGALGFYLPVKGFVIGAGAGYGFGLTQFQNQLHASESYNYIQRARLNTQKYYFDFYVAEKLKTGSIIGFSYKKNLLDLYFFSTGTSNKGFERYNYSGNLNMNEACFFVKAPLNSSGKIMFSFNVGIAAFPEHKIDLLYYPFMRIGLTFKS